MNELRHTVQLDLRYSEWATRTLLAACSGLPVADGNRDLALSHGSVLGTLYHVFLAERFWTKCLSNNAIPPLEEVGVEHPPAVVFLEDLERSWIVVWRGLEQWLESATEEELGQPLACRISATANLQFVRWQLVRHFVNHGSMHRGQVVGMIRSLGKRPPNVDLMSYLLR